MIKNETWTPTPLLKANVLSDLLNSDIWLKREDCTPVKSFKLRGALSVLGDLANSDKSVKKIVAASAGNYGLAIAEACKRNNIESIIFVPEDANISKIERIKLTGSEVIKTGRDFDLYCAKHGSYGPWRHEANPETYMYRGRNEDGKLPYLLYE